MAELEPRQYQRLMEVFDAVCELSSADWSDALDQLCQGDAGLRERVEAMLAADAGDHEGPAVATGVGGAWLAGEVGQWRPPERLGEYRILGTLGAGGMGTVVEAEQDVPRRRVALKVLHGLAGSARSRSLVAREGQAMATLLHPGIPQLYAHGEDDGIPYLAMELVEGHRIDAWAKAQTDQRRVVHALIDVCRAVHHAHLRGVIHCDLKPSNVLVTAAGQPKVLDFGIARVSDAIGGQAEGERAGTPGMMSPEQASGGAVDLRTDVFSLGVVVGQLVGGSADIDAIVTKATQADPTLRYGSADDLASDLARHLAFQPVRARAGGWGYHVGRFLRRHRAAVATLALLFVGLATAAGVSFQLYRQAEAARVEAQAEAARTAAVVGFLEELLTASDPNRTRGEQVTVQEVVAQSSRRLDAGEFAQQPRLQATIRRTLGLTLKALGLERQAEEHFRAVVALHDDGRLEASEDLGIALEHLVQVTRRTGRSREALALSARMLKVVRRLHPTPHPRVADALMRAAQIRTRVGSLSQARRFVQEARSMDVLTGRAASADVDYRTMLLALIELQMGDVDEAERRMERLQTELLATHGKEHTAYAHFRFVFAAIARARGQRSEAFAAVDEVLAVRRKLLDPNHHRLLNARVYRACLQEWFGAAEAAREALIQLLDALTSAGKQDGTVAWRARVCLTSAHRASGEAKQAAALNQRIVARYLDMYGSASRPYAEARGMRGLLWLDGGETARGQAEVEAALQVLQRADAGGGDVARRLRADLAAAKGNKASGR